MAPTTEETAQVERENPCACGGTIRWTEFRRGGKMVDGQMVGGSALFPAPKACRTCLDAEDARRLLADVGDAPRTAAAEPASLLDLLREAGGNPWRFKDGLAAIEPWAGRQKAHAFVQRFVGEIDARASKYDSVKSVLLWGDTGNAKTMLAHGAVLDMLAAGMKPRTGVLLDTWRNLVGELQAAYPTGQSWALLQQRIDADVWVCDDLFSGKFTPDVVDIALGIVNSREGKPTLVTMNGDPNKMPAELGPLLRGEKDADLLRLRSRLGAYRVVQVTGEDDGRLRR